MIKCCDDFKIVTAFIFGYNMNNEIKRLIKAFRYSCDGLVAVLSHPAFRTELLIGSVMTPLALILGKSGIERALLIGSLILVLIVELLNTGIEAAIDRISKELNPISKLAKDVASAAVLLALLNAAIIWFFII